MRIVARVDYAVRALAELAAAGGGPMTAADIASRQRVSNRFTQSILAELRRTGLVAARRGCDGGFWLLSPAEEITLARVFRAVEHAPLIEVRGETVDGLVYAGAARGLPAVWRFTQDTLLDLLERVTIADVAAGRLPGELQR